MSLTQVSHVLDTRDVDEARAVIAAGYCEHHLTVARAQGRFHAVQDEWRVGRVRVHRLRYGVDVTIDAAPLNSSILVSSPVKGVLTVQTRGLEHRYGPGEVVAIGPDHAFGLRWEQDCELRTVQIDRSVLGSQGGGWFDRPESLLPQHGTSRTDAETWHMLTSLLEVHASSGRSTPLLVDRMEALLSTALMAHHAQRTSEGDSTHATQTQIKAAIAYIDEHADQAIGPREMAAAAHMSVRAFQYNLRKYTGKTPSDLLREVRLERAHRDLVVGDPAVDTVAGIAHRWGFGNLGRFSHRYSERFGELPSETLRS